jgi:hypothetical protein
MLAQYSSVGIVTKLLAARSRVRFPVGGGKKGFFSSPKLHILRQKFLSKGGCDDDSVQFGTNVPTFQEKLLSSSSMQMEETVYFEASFHMYWGTRRHILE